MGCIGRGCYSAVRHAASSAAPATLVVRSDPDERALLLAEAPATYYVTEYYERHPVVLVRLATLDRETLRGVLMMSWRLTQSKAAR